jgi:hypothetical protein
LTSSSPLSQISQSAVNRYAIAILYSKGDMALLHEY